MTDAADLPQLYLITPTDFELSTYPDILGSVLDSQNIACVRLTLATRDEDRISRAADALRPVTMERDVALVIDNENVAHHQPCASCCVSNSGIRMVTSAPPSGVAPKSRPPE